MSTPTPEAVEATPRKNAIVDCYRQSFHETDHERSIALREAAEIAIADLERELASRDERIAMLEQLIDRHCEMERLFRERLTDLRISLLHEADKHTPSDPVLYRHYQLTQAPFGWRPENIEEIQKWLRDGAEAAFKGAPKS